jgi:tRNA modification GTPase
MDDSTIAAIATPAGTGGISIIKISGPRAIAIASALFQGASPTLSDAAPPVEFQSHRLHHGHIVDPESRVVLDEILLSVMRAPHSYTCEDVVEINSHGSPAAVRVILENVLRAGARLAEPGEFTRRAFLNGRIDLTQAEAVIDLIHARSARALEISTAQMSGSLRQEILVLRGVCIDLLSGIEAGIDFPEDVEESFDCPAISGLLHAQVIDPIRRLIRLHADGRAIRDGLTVAIAGRPNVGKSSLMNRLLSRERSIVTQFPGTTRDAIEDLLVIKGVPVSVWDTAGLQESGDPVESIGILKTWERCKQADLILFVLEAHKPLSEADLHIFSKIRSRPIVCVFNKIDLLEKNSPEPVIPPDWTGLRRVPVSALNGLGLDELRAAIIQSAWSENVLAGEGNIIPNLRQKVVLQRCSESAEAAADCVEAGETPEIVAIHLKEVVDLLDEVLGARVKTDILENIFNRFCIGK